MNNENKKNYYNFLKGQLQICEEKKDKKLQKQWQEDLEFENKELHNKFIEDSYYEIFVDDFLVNLIEKITKKTVDKDELNCKYRILLEFKYSRIRGDGNYEPDIMASITLMVPAISSDCFGYVSACSNANWCRGFYGNNLMYNFDEVFSCMYKNISAYTEVSCQTSETVFVPMFHRLNRTFDKSILSFECTIEELINMYYMEKQRYEYENNKDHKKTIKYKLSRRK